MELTVSTGSGFPLGQRLLAEMAARTIQGVEGRFGEWEVETFSVRKAHGSLAVEGSVIEATLLIGREEGVALRGVRGRADYATEPLRMSDRLFVLSVGRDFPEGKIPLAAADILLSLLQWATKSPFSTSTSGEGEVNKSDAPRTPRDIPW